MKIDNRILIGAVAVAIVLIAGYLLLGTGATVSAQGESAITVQPDEVSVILNAQARASTAQEAKDNQTAISDAILLSLIKLGIERKDIQTETYMVNPEYDWSSGSGSVLKGYIASQQIVVKTKDFSLVGNIIDSSVDAGALVYGINFELSQSKQNEYKAEALKEASQDAKNKARSTAEGLGKNIGRLVSVQSQEFNYYPYRYYDSGGALGSMANSEAKTAAVSISPKEFEVTARVQVLYKLSLF